MAFALFDFHFLFAGPIVFYALGAWALMAPYWLENFITPGLDEKTYLGDPLNELSVRLYGISLVFLVSILDAVLRHAHAIGDGRTVTSLLGVLSLGILVKIIIYGVFHQLYNPVFTFGPMLFLFPHILTLLLTAFFAWRYWSGQAPVQPQAAVGGRFDIFNLIGFGFSVFWTVLFTVALIWPVVFGKWFAPAFIGTTAESLYSLPPSVMFIRLVGIIFIMINVGLVAGLWRADQTTLNRTMIVSAACVIAIIWIYGDFLRRYTTGTLSWGPVLVLLGLVGEVTLNVIYLGRPAVGGTFHATVPGRYYGTHL